MTETENLVLEHLRAIRAELAQLKDGQRAITARLVGIEEHQVATEKHQIALHADFVSLQITITGMEQRVSRVERRLELEP